MRFLSVSDRKEAAVVCRSWYEASLDPILQRDIIIHFYATSSTGEAITGLSRRKMPHLVLHHFDTSIYSNSVIHKSCEYLTKNLLSLSLKGSNITESTFVELLSCCEMLVSLDLSCCDSLFMSGKLLEKNSEIQKLRHVLIKVKEINLSSIRFLSDATFNRIMTICENVEKLSLGSVQITFNSKAYYPMGETRCASGSVLTFDNILDFIKIQAPNLVSLNLSRTSMTSSHLKSIASIKDLKLRELVLVGCKDVENGGIVELCQYQKSLQALDLSGCVHLKDGALKMIASELHHLQILKLNKCRLITDGSVKQLSQLSQLQVLDLCECYHLSTNGLTLGLCNDRKLSACLTHLNLSGCANITDKFVVQLCQYAVSLVHLDLASCFLISDRSVHAISSYLKHLRFLRLAWCKEITDLGLLGLLMNDISTDSDHNHDNGICRCTRKYKSTEIFKKPTTDLDKDSTLTVRQIQNLMQSGHVVNKLSNISGLQYLDLSNCSKLTDLGLTQAIQFQELRVLQLEMVHGVTDEGMIMIAKNNPSLEELNLSHCVTLTDVALEVIVTKLPRLQNLNVFSCDKLTDKSIKLIQTYCKKLKHLDVSFCSNITYDAVEKFESASKSIQSVQKRMISGGL
ncbi:hypothetical protein ACJMK2_010517 [Sinanodonta woodiana]|uniref:F-box/LRR-repeat protein 15-like leucin rich repeat domain-containing protein n=1 Tax=Sinanodonta woodiana TaxID=1069815 RepID=A0ABD3VIL2_SINWO